MHKLGPLLRNDEKQKSNAIVLTDKPRGCRDAGAHTPGGRARQCRPRARAAAQRRSDVSSLPRSAASRGSAHLNGEGHDEGQVVRQGAVRQQACTLGGDVKRVPCKG